MPTFTRVFADYDRLYAAAGVGQFLLVLPAGSAATAIELDEAWSSTTLRGNFVYSAADPGITRDTAEAFVSAVTRRVVTSGAARGFVWLRNAAAWRKPPLGNDSAPMFGMNANGTQVQTGLNALILPGAALTLANLSTLALSGTNVTIGGAVTFTGASAPVPTAPATTSTLSLDGDARGTLAFTIFLRRQSLHDNSSWGFQFLFPAPATAVQRAAYEWLPLAAATPPNAIGFAVTLDPSNPANQVRSGDGARAVRSRLAFTGRNNDGSTTTLASSYSTTFGLPVTLTPLAGDAALVFNGGVFTSDTVQEFQLAPAGAFTMSTGAGGPLADLMCGLQGTEMISFQPGSDRITFTPYQPAYAPRYPFPEVSSVGPPVDLAAPLLDDTYTTSWATVVRAPGTGGSIPYVAQPKGSSLYGQDALLWKQNTQLMGWLDPADTLPAGVAFPLVPYSLLQATGSEGVTFTPAQTEDFERQVIGPTRRARIGTGSGTGSRRVALGLAGETSGPFNTTTPTGLIATVDGGTWTRILLGQMLSPPQALCFCNPPAPLQQAFQTAQLFLVVANAANLGTFAGGSGTCGSAAQFFNEMEIGGWKLAANVGKDNLYDDYRNVLIVKGRKGKLFDPGDPGASLVANPDKWTQKETFAVPGDDAGDLTILSQWLQNYFTAAAATGDDDFASFNAIAQNENWTGILILRMDIKSVPADLAGITAGISDMSRFNAHHFGIEISQVTNDGGSGPPGPQMKDTSSMFGLIDYVDPDFVPPPAGVAPQPVQPALGAEYDFRLLQLKVLFANSAVSRFQSYAQLTTTTYFDMPVDHMGTGGNPYSALVLRGSLQNNNGQPVYSLSTAGNATFYFQNDVVNKVEITNATMSTRNSGSAPGAPVVSWFSLTGFIDFRIVQGAGDAPFAFDVFSFGSDDGQPDQTRRGLSFSNLGISMAFPPADPTARVFAFQTAEIRFDVATSTPRPKSLFLQFALGIQGLVQGTDKAPPSKSGYTNVVTDARLTGVDGKPWWGIRYQLNMGTPGNLAGKVGLVSSLLTAWSPETSDSSSSGSYQAMVGLQLPGTGGGAKLISLQTVLKLSLGQVLLQYDRDKSAFLLLFTQIGLKLFGLLSIPPGSTLFYLYGNPASAGRPSGLGWYAMYRQKKPV